MPEQKPPLIVEFNGEEYEFPADATDAQISRFLKAIPAANAKDVPKAQTWTAKHPNVAAAAKAVVDTLPAAGALVGGVIATPESFGLATVPGAALGDGVGRGLRDLIAESTGLDEPTSALSKAGRIALDTAETGAVQAVLPGAAEALKTPLKTAGEVIEMLPASRRIAKFLDLGRAAKQLRLEKAPAAILERPAWQANPETVKQEFKAFFNPAKPATAEAAANVPKLKVQETALAMKLLKSGLKAPDVLDTILELRKMPVSWRTLPTDAEVAAVVAARKAARVP